MNISEERKVIVFLAMALSQPRCIKRVISLYESGAQCYVYGYDRGKYDINSYPEGINVTNLGILKDREYFAKFRTILGDILKVRKKHRSNNAIFYAFGFLQALILKTLGEKYIYEISDILYAYPRFHRVTGLLKSIDKKLIRSSLATVMTSGGFHSFFGINAPNVFVIPNKVSPSLNRPPRKKEYEISGKIAFGFVGSIRYESILRFAEVVGESFPHYDFYFWGGTTEKWLNRIQSLTRKYQNIYYCGAFKNPSELPKVYDSFDITVSCYQVMSLNEKIAEPNKLYESLFFCKPIVVSDGIYLSERVKEFGCGFCINVETKDTIRDFISSLTIDIIKQRAIAESEIDFHNLVNNQSSLNEYILKS